MGMLKTIIIIIGIILLIRHFYPDTYGEGRDLLTDTVKDQFENTDYPLNTNHNFTITSYGKDYGKILEETDCVSDQHCIDFFGISSMKCSTTGTCYISN